MLEDLSFLSSPPSPAEALANQILELWRADLAELPPSSALARSTAASIRRAEADPEWFLEAMQQALDHDAQNHADGK